MKSQNTSSFLLSLLMLLLFSSGIKSQDKFPDGTIIQRWFKENKPTDISKLGKKYILTDNGVKNDSTILQTKQVQQVIDLAAKNGGGVIIVPKGTFLISSVFFKQGTHLHLENGAKLKGSDDISDFPVVETRMEGQTIKYFPAIINADGLNGFTISGKGTLDGNGLRFWKAFWKRRQWNPKCTNMDEMRPRIIYVSNSKNVQVEGITVKNSPFWSTHYYKSEFVKLLNLTILAPKEPVKAPSTDAVDIDACTNFLIKNCYMSVNDDAIALKGGKGPKADKTPENGENRNIIIEDNNFGFCHSVLTCGSESIHNYNVILRNSKVKDASRLLHLKMRPDTPQHYEYITVENITGNVKTFLYVKGWSQFFDLKGEEKPKKSLANDILIKNIDISCETAFDVEKSDLYDLIDFTLDNLKIKALKPKEENLGAIKNLKKIKVNVTQVASLDQSYDKKDDSDIAAK
ncbi:glycoside hydrolase family 28 protein [Chryseobacterium viscerum]|uniref:rhamnogalacturonidase n=1 Tax=Chryseobacterium TaxID=59732 RepID=UPI002221C872|nr:glycosyl hydrolase family 28 protein [Chryseobacterium viscerum]MCW1962564.1 glycosyl hydrolase family 28 protein [Chryseobacterium viscerum]WPO89378.1 glycosyl hydrolase family 28 protein [Chryseobacterium sp. HR92]